MSWPVAVHLIGDNEAATAKVRTLWDEEHLYVLFEVEDIQLSAVASDPWRQDSVEVFIDENNGKTSTYQGDDAQYRANLRGAKSGGRNYNPRTFRAVAKLTAGGYRVELAIAFRTIKGYPGKVLGFDAQVNDDPGVGTRASIMKWSDPTDKSFYDTSRFGNLVLQAQEVINGGGPAPGESCD